MSLSILSPLPDWRQKAEALQRELYERNRQFSEVEEALRQERQKTASVERGVDELRTVLNPLYQALQHIYGEIGAMGVNGAASTVASSAPNGRASAAWESWKQKLGANSAAAKIIDILMIHGELTHTQLRIHIGTSRMQTVYDAVSKLNKAALLNKNGDKFSLKEL
jgi:hypothetical protein